MAKLSQHNFANLPSSSASPPSPKSVHQHVPSVEESKDTTSQALLLHVSRLRRRRQRELLLQIDEDRRMQRTPVPSASSSEDQDLSNSENRSPDRRNLFLCSSLSLSTLDLQKNGTIVEEEEEEDSECSTNGGEGDDSRSLFSNEDSSFDSS